MSPKYKFIIDVEKTSVNTVRKFQVGGKAYPLFKLVKNNISVPTSFVVTSSAFDFFLRATGLDSEIKKILDNVSTGKDIGKLIKNLRNRILISPFPKQLEAEILSKINSLSIERYAIRSSANVEDSSQKSWAGGFDTFLNIPHEEVLNSIRHCWVSLLGDRALSYADKLSVLLKAKMPILIQASIESEVSGVAFTRDPLDENDDDLKIEAVFGLGEILVQGQVTPDQYIVERGSNLLLEIVAHKQPIAYVSTKKGGTRTKKISGNYGQKLTGKEIVELAKILFDVERVHGLGRDIEWCKKGNNFYILQSRPITSKFKK